MLLAVDVRNRSIALGFHDGRGWILRRELGAMSDRSADEYGWFMERAFQEAKEKAGIGGEGSGAGVVDGLVAGDEKVDRAIVSSVAPILTPRIVAAISTAFGISAQVVGPGFKTGVKIRSDLPQEVGSDIVCSAAAARNLVAGAPCVIIDFGGAIVFSALNAEGDFVGAAIAPGIETASFSLHAGAALLPQAAFERPERAIGKTTRASIQAGLYYGYSGLVERLAGLFRAELAGSGANPALIEVLVTGDPAGREFLRGLQPCRFVEALALEGLAIISERAGEAEGAKARQHGSKGAGTS